MAYVGYTDILNYIDAVNLGAMVNDWDVTQNVTSPNASATLAGVCQLASNQADAYVASIYSTPFNPPYPKTIYMASVIFACEMLYARRLTPEERNPFKPMADVWRDRLQKIGDGQLPLDANFPRTFTPIAFRAAISRMNGNIY